MGFLAVLNWALAHVPGFMKPAVTWLLDVLRKLTGLIADRWNALGTAVGKFVRGLASFRAALADYLTAALTLSRWIVLVLVPRAVSVATTAIVRLVNAAVAAAVEIGRLAVAALRRAVELTVNAALGLLSDLKAWAKARVDWLTGALADLRHALAPLLGGPVALAEWLAEATIGALGRFLYRQRDRVAVWILEGSPVFTLWLSRTIESVIVRWLS